MKHYILIPIILFLNSANIYAQDENESCSQLTGKEKKKCQISLAEKLEVQMLTTFFIKNNYKQIYEKLDESQRKWMSYRSLYCTKVIYKLPSNNSDEKSLSCMIEITQDRIKMLSKDFK